MKGFGGMPIAAAASAAVAIALTIQPATIQPLRAQPLRAQAVIAQAPAVERAAEGPAYVVTYIEVAPAAKGDAKSGIASPASPAAPNKPAQVPIND